jgi:two-component system, NtrC family, response regulator HydG
MTAKKKILVVDDEVNFCNTLSRILTKKGYETASAKSGFEALKKVREQQPDVVLMDIKMPVMNGVETYKKMKTIAPNATVILMTAFSVDDLIKEAIREGVYAVVHKPFDMETVVNMIERSHDGAFIGIVDDDPNICKTMKSILERQGYSVTTCSTGEEAIELSKERPQDIIFMDKKLPVLNGVETYYEIKKINPNAITIMMTGYKNEPDELLGQALEDDIYTCLYKPLDMDEVIKLIEKVSKKSHGE